MDPSFSSLQEQILALPLGYSEVMFQGKRYGLSRQDFNQGRSLKVYAEELGGPDFVSFNYYVTEKGGLLKPCEMPREKVEAFLSGMDRADRSPPLGS